MYYPKLSLLLLFCSLYALSNCYTHSPVRMFPQHQIIENIVLFKVKPHVESSKIVDLIDELNALASINLTMNISVGELLKSTSTSSLTFTHIFHCRFRSKDHLKDYMAHPDLVHAAFDMLRIVEDIILVNWISNCSGSPKPGSAMRLILLKLNQDLVENEKSKIVNRLIEGIKNQFKSIEYISFGENFSTSMSKGYSIAIMAVFPTPADFETLEVKLNDLIEGKVVVDYVFPPLNVANQFSFIE